MGIEKDAEHVLIPSVRSMNYIFAQVKNAKTKPIEF